MYPFKRIKPVARKPFEDNKLCTFSKAGRNRKSSIVLIEIRFLDSQTFFFFKLDIAVCAKQSTPQLIFVFTWVISAWF